jgi:hypothetical protein
LENLSVYGAVDHDLTIELHKNVTRPVQVKNSGNFQRLRNEIKDEFGEYSWPPLKIENLCKDSMGGANIKYSPSQDFLRHYFTPTNPLKGMLLWWSVGTGKTCAAISTATSSFEKEGYTILWVTRTTLKNDIWKNMFDQICSETIRAKIDTQGTIMPEAQKDRMKLLSKSWSIRPISYKQFSNLVLKQNSYYKRLEKKNGQYDPLHKTLLIIDEAHKLYGGDDLSSIERPNMEELRRAILKSYEVSGDESVRLLLMTATPITKDPMELVKLANLFKPSEQQMPDTFDDFSRVFLDENGKFTEEGKAAYLEHINGSISYLNRSKDIRQFAQPTIQTVYTPIVENIEQIQKFDRKIMRELYESNNGELEKEINSNLKALEGELGDADRNRFNFMKTEVCNGLSGKELKQCEKIVSSKIKLLVEDIKEKSKEFRENIKEIRERLKNDKERKKELLANIIDNTKEFEEEYNEYKNSQVYMLKRTCANRVETVGELKDGVKSHPFFMKIDDELKVLDSKIRDLNDHLKNLVDKQKSRITYLKKMLKGDLNELERLNIRMAIKQEIKDFNAIMKDEKNETKVVEDDIRKTMKQLNKKKSTYYSKLRKTVDKMIKTRKMKLKYNKREEKARIKLLRKTEDYKEEIKDAFIKEKVDAYIQESKEEVQGIIDINNENQAEKQRIAQEKEALRIEHEAAKKTKEVEREAAKQQKNAERLQREAERKSKEVEREAAKQQKNAEREQAQRDKELKLIEKRNMEIARAEAKLRKEAERAEAKQKRETQRLQREQAKLNKTMKKANK